MIPKLIFMNVMVRLCHAIAFETGAKTDAPGAYLKKKEEIIAQLFTLTDQASSADKISSLAESFVLILVKLEARELKQEEYQRISIGGRQGRVQPVGHGAGDGFQGACQHIGQQNKGCISPWRYPGGVEKKVAEI